MKSYPISFHFYTIEVFFFENGKKNGGEDEMATVLPIFIKIDYVNWVSSSLFFPKKNEFEKMINYLENRFQYRFVSFFRKMPKKTADDGAANLPRWRNTELKTGSTFRAKKKTVPARWLVEIAHPPVTFVVVVVVVVVVVAGRDERPCKWSANGPHIPHRSMNNEWNSPKKQQQQQQKEPINQTKPNQTKHTHTHKKHHPT